MEIIQRSMDHLNTVIFRDHQSLRSTEVGVFLEQTHTGTHTGMGVNADLQNISNASLISNCNECTLTAMKISARVQNLIHGTHFEVNEF